MNKREKLTLIEGKFTGEETKEILTSIFSSKINFHNLKNWSSIERYGKDDEIAIKRISVLKKQMERVLEIVSEKKVKNKRFEITSFINISLLDE